MSNNLFSGKILLFGEYAIVKGAKGIALPLRDYAGSLSMAEVPSKLGKNLHLDEFYSFLSGSTILSNKMDLDRLRDDISRGLYFKSNIPHGYGVGSSGALCAAIFANYANDFERKETYSFEELNYLKDMMALMESYYHGTSSGVDCLISLINLPLLVESRNKIKLISLPHLRSAGSFYFYDSGKARTTSALVHNFLSRYESDSEFKSSMNNFMELNNCIIDSLFAGDNPVFEKSFYDISRIQYLHMSDMIPEHVKNTWLQGLESRQYFMKLCGAGGGGFFLVYAPATSDLQFLTKDFKEVNYVPGI